MLYGYFGLLLGPVASQLRATRTGRHTFSLSFVTTDSYVFFFFQAEDGIRDLIVTGVQTCALPISRDRNRWHAAAGYGSVAPPARGRVPWRPDRAAPGPRPSIGSGWTAPRGSGRRSRSSGLQGSPTASPVVGPSPAAQPAAPG